MMRIVFAIVLAAGLLVVPSSRQAGACSCFVSKDVDTNRPYVRASWEYADIAFVGQVVGLGSSGGDQVATFSVHPRGIYRGPVPRRVDVVPDKLCGYTAPEYMRLDERWVVFASKRGDEKWHMSPCSSWPSTTPYFASTLAAMPVPPVGRDHAPTFAAIVVLTLSAAITAATTLALRRNVAR